MSKTRYEISISYSDKSGTKRYVNRVGVLFLDGDRGSIVLPPGVALVGGDGHYINVSLPFDREGQVGGGQGGGGSGATTDDQIPFAPIKGEV